ncbi:TonB-dependent receptor plug domain-containing protein [Paracoccus aerius]
MHRPASRYFVRHVPQLLLGVSMAALGPALALAQPVADPAQPTVLAPITLDAAGLLTGTIDAPAAPYAGGQVSTQVRLGALGNRDAQSAPFRVTGFTEALIQDQQAISLGDLVSNDPSVRQDAPTFSERDSFFIRGFSVTNLDTLFDGLPYLANPAAARLKASRRSMS